MNLICQENPCLFFFPPDFLRVCPTGDTRPWRHQCSEPALPPSRKMLARSAAARRRGLPASWRRAASTAPAASPLRIAVYAGDGIGVDVSRSTFRLLEAVGSSYGFAVEPTWYGWGCDYYDEHGVCAPDDM